MQVNGLVFYKFISCLDKKTKKGAIDGSSEQKFSQKVGTTYTNLVNLVKKIIKNCYKLRLRAQI